MEGLQITWKRVLSVWWLLMWRGVVGGWVLGFAMGFVIGFIAGFAGGTEETAELWAGVAGLIVGLIWSFFVVWMALRKNYRGFRIALVPADAN